MKTEGLKNRKIIERKENQSEKNPQSNEKKCHKSNKKKTMELYEEVKNER